MLSSPSHSHGILIPVKPVSALVKSWNCIPWASLSFHLWVRFWHPLSSGHFQLFLTISYLSNLYQLDRDGRLVICYCSWLVLLHKALWSTLEEVHSHRVDKNQLWRPYFVKLTSQKGVHTCSVLQVLLTYDQIIRNCRSLTLKMIFESSQLITR